MAGLTDGGDDRGFVARWSRRKAAARTAPSDAAPGPVDETTPQGADPAAEEAERQANRAAAEAIDLDSLADKPDVTPFLKAGVPDALRRAALRALFRSSPVLANVDGLVDYGEDFRNPSMILSTFRSAWQAGRGYLDAASDRRSGTETTGADVKPPAQHARADPADDAPSPDDKVSGDPPEPVEPELDPPDVAKGPSLRSRLGLDAPTDGPEPASPASTAGSLRDAE